MNELKYKNNEEKEFCPIPANEKNIPSVTAEFFVEIPMDNVTPGLNVVEGLIFDREGNLYVLHVPAGKVYKIDMETKEVSLFIEMPFHMIPAAIKIHKDGRFFICVIDSDFGSCVAIFSKEGEYLESIVKDTGRVIDDMVFDHDGGFYFSDLGGSIDHPSAGVFYVSNDYKEITPIVERGMVATNGIALSPDEKNLWVTEFGQGKLHHIKIINNKFNVRPLAAFVAYHFTGIDGPDSICVDEDGNVYTAMTGQGRCLIFNKNGMPIGQVLIPNRDKGEMMKSTHVMLRPNTNEAYICSADLKTGKSAIFVAKVFSKAHKSYQFQ